MCLDCALPWGLDRTGNPANWVTAGRTRTHTDFPPTDALQRWHAFELDSQAEVQAGPWERKHGVGQKLELGVQGTAVPSRGLSKPRAPEQGHRTPATGA
jgi:hypothetical protein